MTSHKKKQKDIPTGALSRNLVTGKAVAKLGGKKLELFAKKPFVSKDSYKNLAKKNENENAKIIFDALATLKGTGLKLAQLLSIQGILPEAYTKELSKSHYRVPPLNKAVVRRVIKTEFGKEPEELFQSFNYDAFAAASLGQVHRATSHSGEALAVKVQYPGIAESIHSDLKSLKLLLSTRITNEIFTRMITELEVRLSEEVNYLHEAKQTTWFHENLQLPDIVTPKVHQQLSSKRILTTEFINGMHIDEWLEQSPNQSDRQQIGQLILHSFLSSFYDLNVFHADPNPGNYLVLPDNRLAIIDFGCVKKIDSEIATDHATMFSAFIQGDHTKVKDILIKLGLSMTPKKIDEAYESVIKIGLEYFTAPFRAGTYDLSKCNECIGDLKKVTPKVIFGDSVTGMTTEIMFVDRQFYGVFQLHAYLQTSIDYKNRWIK